MSVPPLRRKVSKPQMVGALEAQARALEQFDRVLGQFNQELAILRRGFWGRMRWLLAGK